MVGLIDDLGNFVSYDWRELTWTTILSSLKRALRGKVVMHKKKPPNKKTSKCNSLFGFSFVFQDSNPIFLIIFYLVVCIVIIVVLLLMLSLHI